MILLRQIPCRLNVFWLFALILLAAGAYPASAACTSAGPGAPNGCGGCNLQNIRKNPVWMNLYNKVVTAGIHPLSCYRSYACQQNLRRTCGSGRAARPGHSNHEGGRVAMDFSTKNGDANRVKKIAQVTLSGNVRQCTHGGGGWHISASAGECKPFSLKSGVVKEYIQEHQAKASPAKGAGTGPCAKISCQERAGKSGLWYKRRSGQWVRMTYEPVR